MTQTLQRATFNRSGLVRILSESLPDTGSPHYDFGEKLGQWLDFSDALNLSAALGSPEKPALAPLSAAINTLPQQLERVRRNLGDAIRNDGVFTDDAGEPPRQRFPTPLPQATADGASDFTPYHRYYLAHQRDMSSAIGALRGNVRKALAQAAPAGRRLADLDATFDTILNTRERNLLATIPMQLARRFAELYREHQATLAGAADDPANWTTPGSWLETFCRDAQAVLLAELELRLKPVAGLIAAHATLSAGQPPSRETPP